MTEQAPEQQADDAAQRDDQPSTADDNATDWKAEARKWEARSRQNHSEVKAMRQQFDAFKSSIGQALGIEQPNDPKQLAENLTAAQREAAAARREAAILRRARNAGANPDALADSASFLRSIESLDPSDLDGLDAAITRAVEANPALKATTPNPGAAFRDATAGRGQIIADADAEALKVLGF